MKVFLIKSNVLPIKKEAPVRVSL